MDLQWLQDTLVEKEFRGQVYWTTTEGTQAFTFLPIPGDGNSGGLKDIGKPHRYDLSSGLGGGLCHKGDLAECGGTNSV